MKIINLALLLIAGASALFAKDLQNSDIIDMVKAGLPEKTIILAIESSPSKFDTSAMALIDLKKQGIGDAIIDAAIKASSPKKDQAVKQANTNDFITEERIVLWDKDAIIDLTAIEGFTRPTLAGAFGMGQGYVLYFQEAKSKNRTANPLPEFEHCLAPNLPGDNTLILIRLQEKTDGRSVVLSGPNRIPKKIIVAMTSKYIANSTRVPAGKKLWHYTLKAPLPPGEYAFWKDGRFYDFGVDAAPVTPPETAK